MFIAFRTQVLYRAKRQRRVRGATMLVPCPNALLFINSVYLRMAIEPSSRSAFLRLFGSRRKAMGRRALLKNPEVEWPLGSSKNALRIHFNVPEENQRRTKGTPKDDLCSPTLEKD